MPGSWHNKMEAQFPEDMREVKFYCSSRFSNTCRRADILLNEKRTCEIQHSFISEKDIVNRFNDWNQFGKDIIWLIDGNEGIIIDKLSSGNYLLTFNQFWKYKSFIKTYDYILLEKEDLIFKIELKKIKSGMIELKETKSLDEIITCLKSNPDDIWNLWDDDNSIKSTLSVYQRGAGNGKTYGIWKSITENKDRKTFIIVTKQHSAKSVIYQELIDQKLRYLETEGKDAYHIDNIEEDCEYSTEKHYVIKYKHKRSKRECIVIIGTIDSFCYNLSHSNTKGSKFFEGIIENMKNNGATKINNGNMKYGGQHVQLSKESEIWIDEVQDLPENYFYAMVRLMYDTSCYINIVGDKLQSLEFNDNFLTKIISNGLPNINIDVKDSENKNRRIKVNNMDKKINELINFNKYNLPEIECDDNIQKEINNEPIQTIKSPIIYANDGDKIKIMNFCKNIFELYRYEVQKNNYKPNNFLIIFPIMKDNVIAAELQTKIQEFWIQKNNNEYTQYVYLHKHTEGTVINTDDSVNATRIMSIRSSKGDGREVVFILGVTEKSLKIFSKNTINLVYESHFHVALTRAKKQIYYGLVENNDDIHKRFQDKGYVPFFPIINKKISLEKIIDRIYKEKFIEILSNNDITYEKILPTEKIIKQKENVDWGYHCIKYKTFYYQVILNILEKKMIICLCVNHNYL